MKTTKTGLLVLLIVSVFTIVMGCSDDDSEIVDSSPQFQSLVTKISSLPGQTFTFKGVFEDPVGIRAINMRYEPWFLDKTITKTDSLYKTYEFSYRFKVPLDAVKNSSHTIPITVTNSDGKAVVKNVVVNLDQDIAKPVIEITQPVNGATVLIGDGVIINFDITVTDEALAEFKIVSSILNETIPVSGTSFTYLSSLDIENAGTYKFTISATDVSGNVDTKVISVNVLNELLFDVMYITDVVDAAGLKEDMFGIPYAAVASTKEGEEGYVFTARYYAPSANTEVRFLPQKESFEPYAFGSDPDTGKLLLGSDATVNPIVLPQEGYYEIEMDLRSESYTVTPYIPEDTTFEQVYIIGTGVFVGDTSTCTNNMDGSKLCWHFNSGKPFIKNPNNPYLWTIEVSIADEPSTDGNNGFILNANANGWSPFWRFDNAVDPESAILDGGEDYVFPAEALGKDYTIAFDTHLKRITVVPQ